MIALLQRVSRASVSMDGTLIGEIGTGLCVFLGFEQADTMAQTGRMAERICHYRVFADEAGRMNRSLLDTGGGLLLVPNFTLAADTGKGTRASFTPAAGPQSAAQLFASLHSHSAALLGRQVAGGRFGASMQVELVNDGPVTFTLACK